MPEFSAGHGIAQCAGQTVEDGSVPEKVPDGLGLALQDLFHEVIDDVAVIPGEARDKPGDVGLPLHRKRRELQRGDPPFCSPLQRCHVPCSQIQTHRVTEVGGGLVRRKPQIRRSDFDELTSGPQASQRQRRVGATGDHHVHPRWKVVKQEGHPVVDVVSVDEVVVVEHQYDLVRDGTEFIQQQYEDCFERRRLR